MLVIIVLEIILLILTNYSIWFQGFYFEKLGVSLFNHSYHIIILKMKLASPPPLLNMLLIEFCLIPLFYKLFKAGNNLLRQFFGG